MLAAPKDKLVNIIKKTARFGEGYALAKYNALYAAAKDASAFGCTLPSNALRIRLYIKTYREYQEHLDAIFAELHKLLANWTERRSVPASPFSRPYRASAS